MPHRDHKERMREIRDLCAQADRLQRSARALCKRLSAQLDALEAQPRPAKARKTALKRSKH